MKTSFTITVETNNMSPIYNTEDEDEWTKENEITEDLESDLHVAIQLWVKQFLTEEAITEAILNDGITGITIPTMGETDDISEYGELKVTFIDTSKDDIQPEVLINIKKLDNDDTVSEETEEVESDEDEETNDVL